MKRDWRLTAVMIIFALCLSATAIAQQATGSPTVRREYRDMILAAIQDVDNMQISSSELQWHLDRIEAHRSSTALIRAVQNELEFRIAGNVWDMYQSVITCRMEAQAGMSLDDCRANNARLRAAALSLANIDPGRIYPHAPREQH